MLQSLPTSSSRSVIRIWPPLLFIVIAVLLRILPSQIPDGPSILPFVGAMAPIGGGLLILLWWLFASRAPWAERLLGVVGMSFAGALAYFGSHVSMQNPATMLMLTVPMGIAGFVLGVMLTRHDDARWRGSFAFIVSLLFFTFSLLLRSSGMWGDAKLELLWRWEKTTEEQLVDSTQLQEEPPGESIEQEQGESVFEAPEWPGFRGENRNSRYIGASIDPDWTQSPPQLLWKNPIGPGWSSYAVADSFLFTQEQRGPKEMIVCYAADTGKAVWTQEVEARFSEPLGGPGPRATPTLAQGHLFVLGADGDLIRLNPSTGSIDWQKNIRQVAGRKPPTWGFSSSPLVTEQHVIVHAGGEGNLGTLAFDIDSGDLSWSAPAGDHSYGSPQLIDLKGAPIVVMLTNQGFQCLGPEDGNVLLSYEWEQSGYRALQPQLVGENRLLVASEMNRGARLFELSRTSEGVSATEAWASRNLKSDFNDFVVFEEHVYGFDGGIFASVDLNTGERNWKGGRYGNGQVLLLEQSGLLLVMSERGEGVLLRATPKDLEELARVPLLSGKTWNHPVLVGDRLYVRNGQEAACYRLSLESTQETVEGNPEE